VNSVRWVLLGAVIGVGNFFTIPNELSQIGALSFLFWHLITLVFLCAPLICAEMMWGKWLRRPLYDSFEVVSPKLKNLAIIILLTIGVAFPPYIYSFAEFILRAVLFFGNSLGISSEYLLTSDYSYLPYFGSVVISGLALITLKLSRDNFVRLIKTLILVGCISGVWVALEVIRQWGVGGHINLLQKGFRGTDFDDVLRISRFSFFSVTLSCSIFYTLVQWIPKRRNEEGGLIGTSFFLILGDFISSLLCFLIVAPFITDKNIILSGDMYLDLIPNSLVYLDGGYFTLFLLFLALLSAGFCTVAVIFWVCAEQLEAGLHQSRHNTIIRLSWWAAVALFLPIIPKLRSGMAETALHVLMPVSGLIFAVCVILKMPGKSQSLMLGDGFLIDPMVKFWRLSMIFLVIPYLVLTLIL
jgi:SNF family Na+-dependent transporter